MSDLYLYYYQTLFHQRVNFPNSADMVRVNIVRVGNRVNVSSGLQLAGYRLSGGSRFCAGLNLITVVVLVSKHRKNFLRLSQDQHKVDKNS